MDAVHYADHRMDNIWLCHAAASIAIAFKHSKPEMSNLCESEATDLIYGAMCTLLRVHSALSKMLEIKVWCQVHGIWMANAKRYEKLFYMLISR
jgi:hypothetical protein